MGYPRQRGGATCVRDMLPCAHVSRRHSRGYGFSPTRRKRSVRSGVACCFAGTRQIMLCCSWQTNFRLAFTSRAERGCQAATGGGGGAAQRHPGVSGAACQPARRDLELLPPGHGPGHRCPSPVPLCWQGAKGGGLELMDDKMKSRRCLYINRNHHPSPLTYESHPIRSRFGTKT